MFDKQMIKEIKIEMLNNDVTQKSLSEALNVSPQYLNMVLLGKCENLKLESKILKYLNLNDTRATIN